MNVEWRQFRRTLLLLGVFNLILLTAGFVEAQAPGTGAIIGHVFDPSGAVIANARVTVVSEATNSSRTVNVTSEGLFHVPLLPPGNYTLVAEAANFQSRTVRSIHVAVTETTPVNITLAVGTATSTKIEVSGSAEMAQTESAALGTVTDQSTIVSLPLANRNFSQI